MICNNCGNENPFYQLNCVQCNSFLRSRVVNIDLWDMIGKLLYSPVKTAENIIQAEHKNFVTICLICAAFKFTLNSIIVTNAFHLVEDHPASFSKGIIHGGLSLIILLLVSSYLITILNNKIGVKNRFKDNFSLYVFAFIPQILILFILTPIEYALFGEYWFTFNPSPFIIKPGTSLILFIIEIMMLIWSGILFITSTYSQTKKNVYSISVGILLFISIIFMIICAPIFIG